MIWGVGDSITGSSLVRVACILRFLSIYISGHARVSNCETADKWLSSWISSSFCSSETCYNHSCIAAACSVELTRFNVQLTALALALKQTINPMLRLSEHKQSSNRHTTLQYHQLKIVLAVAAGCDSKVNLKHRNLIPDVPNLPPNRHMAMPASTAIYRCPSPFQDSNCWIGCA